MTTYKNKYRVESNRWQYWDYSAPGRYFLTVCIKDREPILGRVVAGKMQLSCFGEIVKTEIEKIPTYHPRVILHAWVVMPNHIHLLIELGDYDFHNHYAVVDEKNDNGDNRADNENRARRETVEKIHEFSLPMPQQTTIRKPSSIPQWWHNPDYSPSMDDIKQYRKQRRKMIIPKIMGKLQMLTSKQINIERHTPGMQNWQANYHDHVVRNDISFQRIKNYIINNPKKWHDDRFNDSDKK